MPVSLHNLAPCSSKNYQNIMYISHTLFRGAFWAHSVTHLPSRWCAECVPNDQCTQMNGECSDTCPEGNRVVQGLCAGANCNCCIPDTPEDECSVDGLPIQTFQQAYN